MCSPMRTVTGPESASVIAAAAASASGADGNARRNASPWVSTSTPPRAAAAERTTPRCAASASAYRSGPSS